MIVRIGNAFYRVAVRIVPDPFVLAIGLTFIVMGVAAYRLAVMGGDGIASQVLLGWAKGFMSPGGLAFALQMSLILVTGHALALSPPVQKLILRIASIPKSAAGAATLVAFVSCIAAVIHWGLGAIVGAFLARELAAAAGTRGLKLHYPILGAAAYTGLAVWHGGLSGSAPLKVAETGHFAESLIGVIPLSQTLGSSLNLFTTTALCIVIPAFFLLMTPRHEKDIIPPPPRRSGGEGIEWSPAGEGLVGWLQSTSLFGWILGGFGVLGVIYAVASSKLALDLNAVNLFFLFLGMAANGSIMRYVDVISDGAKGAGAIILQFPFYFGILGVMEAGGLVGWISDLILSVSTPQTLPLIAFYLACFVNMFVPSGGGQWAVQGTILMNASVKLGVPPATTIMAFAYGDSATNMLQPFWALPLLGIMGLQAREIIGYTTMVCILMITVVTATLWFWV